MEKTITFLRGISGSGKSTMAKRMLRQSTNTVICNRDSIRYSLKQSKRPNPEIEYLVDAIEETIIINALVQNKNVIIDNLNLNPKYLKTYKNVIYKALQNIPNKKINKAVIDFTDIPLKKCLMQNKTKKYPIDENIIKKQFKLIPKYNTLWYKEFDDLFSFASIEQSDDLPNAIIFDLDGTLRIVDKNPFDMSSIEADTPNNSIITLNHIFKKMGYKIIICTGRSDKYQKQTEQWLKNNSVFYDKIYMRQDEDNRSDDEIKSDMLFKLINEFNIKYSVDDRNSVVDFWRRQGICTLQCNYGNF